LYGHSHWQWGEVEGRTTFKTEQDADDEVSRRELVGEGVAVFVGNKSMIYRLCSDVGVELGERDAGEPRPRKG
jgi:hypothetical protein